MKQRILTAVVLVPLLLAVLYALPKVITVLLFCLLCAVAAYELLYGTGLVRHVRMVAYAVVFAAAVPVWCWLGMNTLAANVALLVFFCLLLCLGFLQQVNIVDDRCERSFDIMRYVCN
mgnify:CR=1 FL=1